MLLLLTPNPPPLRNPPLTSHSKIAIGDTSSEEAEEVRTLVPEKLAEPPWNHNATLLRGEKVPVTTTLITTFFMHESFKPHSVCRLTISNSLYQHLKQS